MSNPIRRLRVTKARAVTQSIVEKGAAENSAAFLLQAAPALVADAPDPGASDALADDIWHAFCDTVAQAATPDEIAAAIDKLPVLLKQELLAEGPGEGNEPAGTAGAPAVAPESATPEQPTTGPIAPEASSPAVTDTPVQPVPAVTPESVQAMITQALVPLAAELAEALAAKGATEQQLAETKTQLAVLQSKLVPASRQPDAEPTPAVTQAAPTSPYAGSGLDAYLRQQFHR